MINKEDLFKDLFQKIIELDEIIEEAGLSSLATDCEDEECEITDDEEIITVHKLFQEAYRLLEDYE